jgi:hypothetical protein
MSRWRLCWCFLRDDDDPFLFEGKKWEAQDTKRLPTIKEESETWWRYKKHTDSNRRDKRLQWEGREFMQ